MVLVESGKKYSRLTVLQRAGTNNAHQATWLCRCDCGKETVVAGHSLRRGFTKSCGCLRANRLPKGEAAFRMMYLGIKRNAKRRDLDWELTRDQTRELVKQPCHYCGIAPLQCAKGRWNRLNGDFLYNGLDRIDNNIGYIHSNIVSCCGRCNRAKDTMGIEEFREWIAKIHERFQGGF